MIPDLSAQHAELVQIPARKDNYIYLLHDHLNQRTAVIDPADAEPVLAVLAQRGWSLNYILATHHHGDHIGGNLALKEATGCEVYGYSNDAHRIPGIDHLLADGQTLTLGHFTAEVMFIPGHTLGHIAYYFPALSLLFCGDTLFSLGCGRLFEGTPQQMYDSLMRIAALPDDTWVCCGHEYTEANIQFALSLEDAPEGLHAKQRAVEILRRDHQPTVPSMLGEEKKYNPFLRCTNAEAFARLRAMKDAFV